MVPRSEPPAGESVQVALFEEQTMLLEHVAEALAALAVPVVATGDSADLVRTLNTGNVTVAVIGVGHCWDESGPAPLEFFREVLRARRGAKIIALVPRPTAEQMKALKDLGVEAVVDKCIAPTAHLVAQVVGAVNSRSSHQFLLTPPNGLEPVSTGLRPTEPISEREREVLQLVAEGADNLKIAALLGITERTVRAHTASLYRKLAVENRVQLALRAAEFLTKR